MEGFFAIIPSEVELEIKPYLGGNQILRKVIVFITMLALIALLGSAFVCLRSDRQVGAILSFRISHRNEKTPGN